MGLSNHRSSQNYIPPELVDLIPGYLHRREEDILALRSFLAGKDFKSIKMLAHKLKGNGSSFGFDRISDLGGSLMQASDGQNVEEILKLISDLRAEIDQIKTRGIV